MDALVSSLGKRGITLERKVVKYEIKLGLTFMVLDLVHKFLMIFLWET
jgi:hypothetical protein